MHFSLNASFFVLVLAQILAIGPVNAHESDHLIKRASDRFHKSALRHSADLAHDLRTTFGGLGGSYAARASLARRSSDGSKPFCVSNRASVNQTGTVANFNNASSTVSATGTKQAIPSSTSSLATSPTPSTAQSDFHLVQSYSGSTFFAGWDFFTDPDPTHGLVQFVDGPTAVRAIEHFLPPEAHLIALFP